MICASRWQPCIGNVGKYLGLMQEEFELRHIRGYATPPEELFVDISEDKFLQQFSRLRSWVHTLEGAPYAHEFHNLKSGERHR